MAFGLSITTPHEGAAHTDPSARREVKYVFTRYDVGTLRGLLLRFCRPIVYAGPVSTVRSIYFDDPLLSTCRANLDGVGVRHKTRLRWYDHLEPSGCSFLEAKWRHHRVCGKHRLQLESDLPIARVPFRTLHSTLCTRSPVGRYGHLACETEPVVLVEYQREHFALRDGSARLTLDYGIRFYPQLGRRRLSFSFADPLPGVVIIECKTALDEKVSLHGILSPLRVRAARFSKYVHACRHLGYVNAT